MDSKVESMSENKEYIDLYTDTKDTVTVNKKSKKIYNNEIPTVYKQFKGLFDYANTYDYLSECLAKSYNKSKKPVVFVEIGNFFGSSLCYMAEKLRGYNTEYSVIGIDNLSFDNSALEENISVMKDNGLNVSLIKGNSSDVISEFEDESIDCVFIDGDHSYEGCMKDILSSVNKITVGGFMSGHDYAHPHCQGVKRAVNDFSYINKCPFILTPTDGTLDVKMFCYTFCY